MSESKSKADEEVSIEVIYAKIDRLRHGEKKAVEQLFKGMSNSGYIAPAPMGRSETYVTFHASRLGSAADMWQLVGGFAVDYVIRDKDEFVRFFNTCFRGRLSGMTDVTAGQLWRLAYADAGCTLQTFTAFVLRVGTGATGAGELSHGDVIDAAYALIIGRDDAKTESDSINTTRKLLRELWSPWSTRLASINKAMGGAKGVLSFGHGSAKRFAEEGSVSGDGRLWLVLSLCPGDHHPDEHVSLLAGCDVKKPYTIGTKDTTLDLDQMLSSFPRMLADTTADLMKSRSVAAISIDARLNPSKSHYRKAARGKDAEELAKLLVQQERLYIAGIVEDRVSVIDAIIGQTKRLLDDSSVKGNDRDALVLSLSLLDIRRKSAIDEVVNSSTNGVLGDLVKKSINLDGGSRSALSRELVMTKEERKLEAERLSSGVGQIKSKLTELPVKSIYELAEMVKSVGNGYLDLTPASLELFLEGINAHTKRCADMHGNDTDRYFDGKTVFVANSKAENRIYVCMRDPVDRVVRAVAMSDVGPDIVEFNRIIAPKTAPHSVVLGTTRSGLYV